jgi:very-short-patch-repair endonuclease
VGPRDAAYGDHQGPPDLAVQRLASTQHGVVAQSQLIDLGLTPQAIYRRRLRGNLIALHRGVYAVGHIALTARSRELAAVLACGPEAMLSHRSAAALWGLRRTSSPRIEVTAPRGRKPRDGIVVHRSRVLEEEDRALMDAIPITSVARTLVDLADVLQPSSLEKAVNEAELLGLFDFCGLERTLERVFPRRGRGRLAGVLQAYRSQPQFTRSSGERRLLRVCREHGLPCPKANLWVAGHEIDLYWPDARLAVEFDGRAVHRTTRAFHDDRRRDRALAACGIQVVRVTERDLDDEATLAGELQQIRGLRLASRPAR